MRHETKSTAKSRGKPPLPGNRLREMRERAGLTLEAAADKIGMTHGNLSKIERGKRQLRTARLARLAQVYGCQPEDLVAEGPARQRVPVIDWVQAGRFAESTNPYPKGLGRRRIMIEHHRSTLIALDVRGGSINRVAPDGSIIVVDYADKLLIERKFYVIRDGDDVTVKLYRTKPERFEPYSSEPDHPTIFPNDHVEIVGRVIKVEREL